VSANVRSSRPWRRIKAQILAGSDVCHICGEPGADSVDHLVPVALGGTNDPANLRPAHHDVPPYCNRVKGDREYAAPILKRSGSLRTPRAGDPMPPSSGRSSA